MKHSAIFIILTCIIAVACSKNENGYNNISGNWELREELGGIAGKISYAPGNGTVWMFNNNSQFKIVTINGAAINGSYQLKASLHPGDYLLQLQFNQNGQPQSITDSIRFVKNQLVVLPSAACCDIPTSYYDRLK